MIQRLIADVTAVLKRNGLDEFTVTDISGRDFLKYKIDFGIDIQLGEGWNYLDLADLDSLKLIAVTYGLTHIRIWVDGSKGIEMFR